VTSAAAGDAVVVQLADEIDLSRGEMLVRKQNLPQVASELECTLCWLHDEPLQVQTPYLLQHTSHSVRAWVSELAYRIDVDTLHREPAQRLALNEIGRVSLTTSQPLYFDPYKLNRQTGSFILIDPASQQTVGAGLIRRRTRTLDEVATPLRPSAGQTLSAPPRSPDVVWAAGGVSRIQREQRNGHRACVVWFTGLSGSGKSTLARRLESRLFGLGVQTGALDGDNLRHGLNGDLGFTPEDRRENVRRVGEVARLGFEAGQVVLCSLVSPYAQEREQVRALLPAGRFVEVYVKCDLEVLKRRDPKGLYARAAAGEVAELTGVSAPYEEPTQPDLVIETDLTPVDQAVEAILALLTRLNILNPE
jgi:bifunctional enzyme CysN/CysC